MSQQRNHARPRPGGPSISPSSPLLSSSTITFLASWRGQLLICTVVLILGGVYFVLQEPIAQYRRRRREALSRARGEELMSMEDKDKDKDKAKTTEKEAEEMSPKEKRGREKKKDVKKRKGSLLRVPAAIGSGESGASSAGVSSIESSPVPGRLPRPTPPRPQASPSKAKMRDLPVVNEAQSDPRIEGSSTSNHNGDASPRRGLEPSLFPATDTTPKPSRLQPPQSVSPWDVPLPASPLAGPSRSPLLSGNDIDSADGDHGNTSESAQSNHGNGESDATSTSNGIKLKSIEFSIIPEEGYLPIAQPLSVSKKKKRKNRAPAPQPLPNLERRVSVSADSPAANGAVQDSPAVPVTPSRQARKASLNRPINADLEELLTEREQMIESLRAENGLAKAEEAKAKDELSRAKATEERLKSDVERARKGGQRLENEGRKRESELTARLNHLTNLYAGAVQRISTLEAMFRDQQGNSTLLPPPSPGMIHPGNSPSLVPGQHLQPMPSPLPPPSPFGMGMPMGYAPSPRAASGGFIPFPSPGMFPAPMLHPNFHSHSHPHSHSPSPFRRASTSGLGDELAGPLTPGHPTPPPGSAQFPFDLGIMPSPSPANANPTPNAPPTAADLRRLSIESSVLKKKAQQPRSDRSESGEESNRGSDPLPDIDETASVQGLGMGDVGGSGSIESATLTINESGADSNARRVGLGDDAESIRSSSHQSSPSPPNRRSMLLTPASADVFHRALVQGTDTPDGFEQREPIGGMNDIKVIADAERGNLYYRDMGDRTSFGSDGAHANGQAEGHVEALDQRPNGPDGHASGHPNGTIDIGEDVETHEAEDAGPTEDYVPMFASLAHTPQQLAEIQRMREGAMKAKQRDAAGRAASTPGV